MERNNLIKNITLILCLTICSSITFAQTNKEKALEIGREAIRIMDEGKIQESIAMLTEAKELDPENYVYPYEIAYAYFLANDYQKSIDIATELLTHKDVNADIYQMLGSVLDYNGQPDKALEVLQEGMNNFPNKGSFYLASGVVEYERKNYNKAIDYWEQGIKVEPNYSSNYYQLAKIFNLTDERVWTLIYGEIFMNLEYGSQRTEEISRLMYENYQSSYEPLSDSSGQFHLTKKGFVINVSDEKALNREKNNLLPLEGVYSAVYSMSAINFHEGVDIESIYNARLNFVENWYSKFNKQYEHILLNYQQQMKKDGVFEAYSYWLVSQGDIEAFNKWYASNEESFNKFAEWIKANSINIDTSDTYSRMDY